MVSRGAKNLIFFTSREETIRLSRNFLEELNSARITVKTAVCDISNLDQLSSALKACQSMPPIKGCIQAAMLLKVLHSSPI
jgi:hypothetical protein